MRGSEENRFKEYSSNLNFGYLLDLKFAKLILKESKINGKGIYAEEKIKKGQVICPLLGIIYNISKSKVKYPKFSYQLSDDLALEPINEPTFFNHSCDFNSYINEDWMFEAIKDIEKGEEITIDYGAVDYLDYSFDCNCKSDNCRRSFDGKFSANLKFQKKMSKYFSPYLKQKFNIIAPEIFRQRLLIELITKREINETLVKDFLNQIVKELELRTSGNPIIYKSGEGKPQNQGVEGFVPLIDSGITINAWAESGLISIFLHTCKEFSEEKALKFIKDYFKPKEIFSKTI